MYEPPPAVDDDKYQRALERAELFERTSRELEEISRGTPVQNDFYRAVDASNVVMSTASAMPSRWTFQIPPVHQFIERHIGHMRDCVIVDPFCGTSHVGTLRNDLGQGGMLADVWCEQLLAAGTLADAVLFDPPYSPRQISECYKSVGLKATGADTQNAALYSRVKKPLAAMLKQGGIALSFGWQSSGFSKEQFRTKEILLVQHGGAHNDTICVAQVKL